MFSIKIPLNIRLYDFLIGCIIQVNVNGFLSSQINPKAGIPQGSVLSSLLFLIYLNEFPTPQHKPNPLSQFADYTAQWTFSLNVRFAAKFLQQDLLNLAMWCAKWKIKLNPKKTKVIMFYSIKQGCSTQSAISLVSDLSQTFTLNPLTPTNIC